MPGGRKAPGQNLRRAEKMGAVIWFLFIAAVTAVLERETLFPDLCRGTRRRKDGYRVEPVLVPETETRRPWQGTA